MEGDGGVGETEFVEGFFEFFVVVRVFGVYACEDYCLRHFIPRKRFNLLRLNIKSITNFSITHVFHIRHKIANLPSFKFTCLY